MATPCAVPKDASPADFAAIQFDYIVIGLQPPTQNRDVGADHVSVSAGGGTAGVTLSARYVEMICQLLSLALIYMFQAR